VSSATDTHALTVLRFVRWS